MLIPEENHLFILCEDNMTMDLLPELAKACDFINKHLESGAVLIHCNRGVSRSATVMMAYLMQSQKQDVDTTLAYVKEKRRIRPNENFMEQLEVWEATEGNIWAESGVPKKEYAEYLEKRKKRLEEAGLTGDEPIGSL